MAYVYLAELSATVDAAGTLAVFRYSSGAGYAHPSAPGFYEPRIRQPANFRRDIFTEGRIGGGSRPGYGELVLINNDGALDPLIEGGFAGLPFRLLHGDEAAPYGSFATLLAGVAEQPTFAWNEVRLRLRDRQSLFQRAIQARLFRGDNVLPDGLEGTEGDLKGRPLPLLWGRVRNVSPPQVNSARLIYRINDGVVDDVDAVYDRGAALTRGADYADRSAMEATAPAAGTYRVWPGGGCFRLGSSPAGLVTADALAGGGAAGRCAAAIVAAIVTGRGGLTEADIAAGDLAALAAVAPSEVGLWVADDATLAATLDRLAESVGAWWGFDRFGRFRIRRIEAPAGVPAVRFLVAGAARATKAGDVDIQSIERVPAADPGRSIPCWQVRLGYGRNWTVQTGDLAGIVDAARRAWLARGERCAVAADPAVRTRYPLACELVFGDAATIAEASTDATASGTGSLLTMAVDAEAEAARRLALFGVRRDRLKIKCRLDPDLIERLDLGATVAVDIDRFDYGAGKSFIVTGLQYDGAGNLCDIELWG